MVFDQLKPNIIVRGPIFPEPVQLIVAIPMGSSVKLVGKGLNTNQVHEPILSPEQLAQLESTLSSPERWTDTWVKMPGGKWQCVGSHSSTAKK